MNNFEKILENIQINNWIKHFANSPLRQNQPHQSDAELILIHENHPDFLALTTDTVCEEIAAGLYRDPFTMGWVAIMANFSDLAAVGAQPLGILTSVALSSNQTEEFNHRIAEGMAAACNDLGVFVLGGDINSAAVPSLTGCAVGLVPRKFVLSRCGCKSGDVLFLSGPAGTGSALGLCRFGKMPEELFPENLYRPKARLKEGQLLRQFASCAMDTSDGVLTTLDQLMRLNSCGFKITTPLEKVLHPAAQRLVQKARLPEWTLLAGHHGEFELIFTVPSEKVDLLMKTAAQQGWQPVQLGEVIQENSILQVESEKVYEINSEKIRNLFVTCQGDLSRYIAEIVNCRF